MPKRTPYADTEVAVERSQTCIRELLVDNGAKAVRFTYRQTEAIVEFLLPSPYPDSPDIGYRIEVDTRRVKQPSRWTTSSADRLVRQVWRVLWWWLKAKMEAAQFGLVDKETELLPYMLVRGEHGTTTIAGIILPRMAAGLPSGDDLFGGITPLPPGEVKEEEADDAKP